MTSLSLSGLFLRVSGVRTLPKRIHDEEMIQMKLLVFGSNAMVMLSSAIVVMSLDQMSDLSQLLIAFIGGTFGVASFMGIYGTKSAQEIAAKTTASVSLSGFVSPFLMDVMASRCGLQTNFRTLLFISGAIGFGGPYLLLKYGQTFADMLANWGLKKARDISGGSDSK